MIKSRKDWKREKFPASVEVVELAALQRSYHDRSLEQLLLYRGPRFLIHRAFGRGKPRSRRLVKAYERRFANKVHRRLAVPTSEKLYGDIDRRMLRKSVVRGGEYDAIVVHDPFSIPLAAEIIALYGEVGRPVPVVSYSVDHLPPSFVSPERSR